MRLRHACIRVVALLAAPAVFVVGVPAVDGVAVAAPGGAWAVSQYNSYDHQYVSAFADGTVYTTHDLGYARSLDHGVTNHPMPAPDPLVDLWGSIRFGSPKIGFALSENEHYDPGTCGERARMWRTTLGGLLWEPICLPTPALGHRFRGFPLGWSLGVAPGGRGVLVLGEEVEVPESPMMPAGVCLSRVTVAYHSADSGQTWSRAVLGGDELQPAYLRKMATDTMAVFAVFDMVPTSECQNGERSRASTTQRIVRFTAGSPLTTLRTCAAPEPLCTAAYALSANHVLVGRVDASTVTTGDGGATWNAGQVLRAPAPPLGPDPRSRWVQAFDFADSRHGFASTNGFGTWRTSDGGTSWVQEVSHECRYADGGTGDISAGTRWHAVTAGPKLVSARVSTVSAGTACDGVHPTGVTTSEIAVEAAGYRVKVTGELTITPPAHDRTVLLPG